VWALPPRSSATWPRARFTSLSVVGGNSSRHFTQGAPFDPAPSLHLSVDHDHGSAPGVSPRPEKGRTRPRTAPPHGRAFPLWTRGAASPPSRSHTCRSTAARGAPTPCVPRQRRQPRSRADPTQPRNPAARSPKCASASARAALAAAWRPRGARGREAFCLMSRHPSRMKICRGRASGGVVDRGRSRWSSTPGVVTGVQVPHCGKATGLRQSWRTAQATTDCSHWRAER